MTLLVLPLASLGFLLKSPPHHSLHHLAQSLEDYPEDPAHRGWRRALRKALKPRRTRKDSVFALTKKDGAPGKGMTAMNMAVLVEDGSRLAEMFSDFERFSPSDVFPHLDVDQNGFSYVGALPDLMLKDERTTIMNTPSEEYDDELLVNLDVNRGKIKATPVDETTAQATVLRSTIIKTAVKNWFESLLLGLFQRWSLEPAQNFKVTVEPKGNVVRRILRGKVKADMEITFSKLVLKPIQLSSGSIQAKRLLLNLWSFTPDLVRKGAIRYPAQFDFHLTDCVFTEKDLFRSRSIRNGLQRLLGRVLTRAGVSSTQVVVNSIRLLPNGKISCSGEARSAFGGQMPFEVRSKIELASRGHVVTFPGLEVSLQPSLGLFVPVLPEIDLDVGHNARLVSVVIDGAAKTLTINAKATVTPEHTLKLKKYLQTKESYSAHFTFDVGQWLTKIGNFSQ